MKPSMRLAGVLSAIALALSGAVLGAGTGGSSDSRDVAEKLDRAEELIENGSYRDAIPVLQEVVESDDDNADAYNYLGFAYRNLGDYEKSGEFYDRALSIDPEHRGAREYLGELYLKLDNLSAAEEQLARLDEICSFGCSEYDELKSAIEAYRQSQ